MHRAELDGRVAEHLLGVEREDERHPEGRWSENTQIAALAPTSVRERRMRNGRERRLRARLQRPRRAANSAAEPASRPDGAGSPQPASGASTMLVHEQGRGPPSPTAPRPGRSSRRRPPPRLSCSSRGASEQRDRAPIGHVDEEDPLPAELSVSGPPISQPAVAPIPAQRAPDAQRLVALGARLEGRDDDRQRGRRQDRGADALDRPRSRSARRATMRARTAATPA